MSEPVELNPAVLNLVVDHWRLLRLLERVGDQLPHNAAARVAGQVRFQEARLATLLGGMGLTLATYEGRPFDGSLPPTAQNADEFSLELAPRVGQTLEPTLLRDGRVVHAGRVHLQASGDT